MTDQIRILIADDKKEICESLEQNVLICAEKFGIKPNQLLIAKVYTEHAYDHGCKVINEGFIPDICLFDLVFNGYTGIDLYKYLQTKTNGKKTWLTIYTGVERNYTKRKEAEIMASQTGGSKQIKIIAKPNISEVLVWVEDLFMTEWKFNRIIQNEISDPFDLL
jgi:hypothetical protein